jgi:hypothetical protein
MNIYGKKTLPENVQEYFDNLVQRMKGCRLLVILDPKRLLKLNNSYIDASGNEWRVYKYCENDLSFRLEYTEKPADPNFRHIIWVTYSPGVNSGKINLSFIGDVLEYADKILDFNLLAVLEEFLPDEVWPEDSILQYESEIANRLSRFITNAISLRKILPKGNPLNQNHILALVLASGPASLPIDKLIFDVSNPIKLIEAYLCLIYSFELHEEEKIVLGQLVKNYARNWKGVESWLEIDELDLSFLLYSWSILQRYNVDNPLNQIKGWGVLGFDPEKLLVEMVNEVVNAINKNEKVWVEVMKLAEGVALEGTVRKLVDTLPIKSLNQLCGSIQNEVSPMLVYGLCIKLLETIVKQKSWQKDGISIPVELSSHRLFGDVLSQSKYLPAAQALLGFLDDMSFIQKLLSESIALSDELVNFLDSYRENRYYRLEFVFSRCLQRLKVIDEKELRDEIWKYLENPIKIDIQNVLGKLDMHLVELIEKNWEEYTRHPRLSCNFINDFVVKRSFEPSDNHRLWLLILDGMRLDTWEEVVKPYLQERFEILEQVVYISPLPSTTKIARTSLLAGRLPPNWQDYQNNYSTDEQTLASRNLLLSSTAGKSKLRIVVSSETDYGQRKLDLDIKPYNILIYNLSDNWIHTFKGDISQLNEVIKSYLEKNLLPDLVNRIGDNDYILVTSDHGFIELSRDKGINVDSEEPNQINLRYLDNIDVKKGFRVEYRKGEFFTLAKGREWFSRGKGGFSRYAHGGISLDEMIVPGVLMRKITKPIIAFEFVGEIRPLEIIEDTEVEIEIGVKNSGNIESSFQLTVETDIGKKGTFTHKVSPFNTKLCIFKCKPSLESKRIQMVLQYEDAKGDKKQKINTIPIKVEKKKEKFEMDLSALDKFEM